MTFREIQFFGACLLGTLLVGGFAGCGGGASPDEVLSTANESNIQRLGNLYTKFQSSHNWDGPANEAEFKEFIGKLDGDKLARIGVERGKIDELFISQRDGEPFQIRFSIRGGPRGCTEPAIFESTGVGGKRMVGFLNMVQRDVEASEYDKLWSGASTPSAASSKPDRR